MKLQNLKTILESTGYPVAYSHFIESENEPLPQPPFITYSAVDSFNFMADNKVHVNAEDIEITLYTKYKDLEAEKKIETVLNDHELPFAASETFLQSEELYIKIYEMRLF